MSPVTKSSTTRNEARNDAGVPLFLDENKALACIHCGLCLGSCPTYLETGNENDSPRGRIYLMRALQDGRLALETEAARHLDLCLGCRACEAVCPSGVQYGALLEHTRDHVEHHYQRPWFQRFLRRIAIERVFPFPTRMKLALLPLRGLRWIGLDRWLPKFLKDAAALVPRDAQGVDLKETYGVEAAGGAASGIPQSVGFVSGCVMPVLFGATQHNSIHLLNRQGLEVKIPRDQGCCGALYAHSGQLELARECARKNIAAFEAIAVSTIVINAAGCGSTLKEYGSLLADDPEWADRAAAFAAKVKDLSEVLVVESGPASAASKERVTYHDACHLAHAQRIVREPRQLIRRVAGTGFVELPESDVCCGSAGTYNLTEPAMAERLQSRKVENILKSGATVVVTTNPGCLLQIRAGLERAGANHIRVMHLADFLAESPASSV